MVVGVLELALLSVQHIYDGLPMAWDWPLCHSKTVSPLARLSLLSFYTAFISMATALRWMAGEWQFRSL